MIKSEYQEYIIEGFSYIFEKPIEPRRMKALIKIFGERKVAQVINLLLANGTSIKNKREEVKDNPYGLIFFVAKRTCFPEEFTLP